MIVGICGAPSCGKTTLARALVNRLNLEGYNSDYVGEYARHYLNKCRQKGSPYIRTPLHQATILRGQLDWEDSVPPSVDFVISDSPVLAHAIYTYSSVDFSDLSHTEYYFGYYKDMILKHRDRYAYLFYLPPLIAFKADGTRSHDEARAKRIGDQIKAFLVFHQIPFHEILETDLQKRVQICLDILVGQ